MQSNGRRGKAALPILFVHLKDRREQSCMRSIKVTGVGLRLRQPVQVLTVECNSADDVVNLMVSVAPRTLSSNNNS